MPNSDTVSGLSRFSFVTAGSRHGAIAAADRPTSVRCRHGAGFKQGPGQVHRTFARVLLPFIVGKVGHDQQVLQAGPDDVEQQFGFVSAVMIQQCPRHAACRRQHVERCPVTAVAREQVGRMLQNGPALVIVIECSLASHRFVLCGVRDQSWLTWRSTARTDASLDAAVCKSSSGRELPQAASPAYFENHHACAAASPERMAQHRKDGRGRCQAC